MKKAFSLIEIIFAIMVIAIIASVALPKFMGAGTDAKYAVIKKDISTIVSAVQTHSLLHGVPDTILETVTMNSSDWSESPDGKTLTFIESSGECLNLALTSSSLDLTLTGDGPVCQKLKSSSIEDISYALE